MNKGLNINGEVVEFNKWSIGDVSYATITKSFKIKFKDIKIVTISPRLAMDDEILIISLIDKEGEFRQFSSNEFEKEPIKKFEEKLNLKSIRNHEWEKFSWDEHENSITDKVIYSENLYWEDLFIKPIGLEKILIQILKFLGIKKSIGGRFNPKIEKIIKGEL